MARRLIVAAFALALVASAHAATLTYSHTFSQGVTYCPGNPQYDEWLTYRASLDTGTLTFVSCTVKGSQDPIGRTCTDPSIVDQIADALRNRTFLNIPCDGNTWEVGVSCWSGACGSSSSNDCVLSVGGSQCSCSSTYNLRPGITNPNWGGITGGSCSQPTQVMTVEFLTSGGGTGGTGMPGTSSSSRALLAGLLLVAAIGITMRRSA